MNEKCLRKSGIDIIGNVPWGTHICLFYQTNEDLTDILVPYFKAGLENNEFCLWITSQLLGVEEVKESLRKSVPDIDVYLEKGQIEILFYTQWYVNEGVFESERVLKSLAEKQTSALYNGYNGMRLSGDTSWLGKEYKDSFIKYEEKMDNIIDNYQMIALCPYSLDSLSTIEIIKLGANHQFTLIKNEGIWELIESSKRKLAKETAARASNDWKHTFDTVPDLIAIIDTNYKVVRANRSMASKLGMTPEECIGLTCYRVVHEASKPPAFCPHRQMLMDGFEHTSEVCEDCWGGYFTVSVSPQYDSDGKLIGGIHIARDISERRQMEEVLRKSEEKFRNLIETANEGIHVIDAEYRNTYVNEKMAEMLGYSREDLIGKSVRDFTDDEGKAVFEMNMKKRRQGISESHEFRYIRKDGSPLWAQVNSKALFDKDGNFAGSISMLTDITKRKEAETKLKETLDNLENLVKARTEELETAYKSLKESESSLAEAQKMAHLGNWDRNLTTGEVYWSDEMYRIFCHNPQEPIPAFGDIFDYLHPDDRAKVNDAVKEAFNGKHVSTNYRVILTNGEERIIHEKCEVVFDEKKHPVRIKGTVQDITELKKSEEKIRNLASIVESSNDAIGTVSLDCSITSWNKGAEHVFGYSAEEILGKPISILAPSSLAGEAKKLSEGIKQGKSVSNCETLRLRKDGKIIFVSITLSPVFDSHGKLTVISFISRDITESKKIEEKLRESEEKYRNIVETANEGIGIIDSEFKITYSNKRMANMLGYAPEEGIGRSIWDFLSEDSKAIVKLNLKNRLLCLDGSYELKLIHKDGAPIWAHMNSRALLDMKDKYIGSVSMFTDITRRKKAEQELAEIEIARKKEIHHRIKNNLQVISSLLDLQAEKFKNKESITYSEVLDAFRESQDRVISMALIHEELYKGCGPEKLNFSPYINELADNLIRTYSFGNTDINLNLSLEESIFFDMDIAVPLGMIINELVSNSFKHAFRGRAKGDILIKLHREEKREYIRSVTGDLKSTTFILEVSDSGVGIPEDLNIEELDSLGLQLVTSLVNQIDGELELKRDNGTTFIVRFKVRENNIASVPASQLVDNE